MYPLADGTIAASLRSVSAVIIIDRATGGTTWRLGPDAVAQQHCPSELPDGSLLLFDNGTFRTGESVTYSRVIEVDRRTQEITWQYRDSPPENFFTPFMGSAQRLPNGNTLVTESAFGRIFEVDRTGKVCWEYVVPYFSAYHDQEAATLFPTRPTRSSAPTGTRRTRCPGSAPPSRMPLARVGAVAVRPAARGYTGYSVGPVV